MERSHGFLKIRLKSSGPPENIKKKKMEIPNWRVFEEKVTIFAYFQHLFSLIKNKEIGNY